MTQWILIAEELNMHFSSVFTREDTSSLPVPETKFNGTEGERLGQLIVTPEVVASKINNMKGVDGISPKIIKATVEQNKYIVRLLHTCLTCHHRRELYRRMERCKHHSFIQKWFKKQVC